MKQEKEEKAKKEYHSPSLQKYGDMREITKRIGNRSRNDGGSGKRKRTGL